MNMSSGCSLLNGGQNGSPDEGLRSSCSVPRAHLGLQVDSGQDRMMANSSKSNPRPSDFHTGATDQSHHLNRRHQNKGYSDLGADGASNCTTGVDLIAPALLLNEALCKYASNLSTSVPETNFPDDSKLLANPKGIIKSYLPQASAMNPEKFESYRRLCLSHVKEYFKHQKGGIGALCLLCNMTCKHWNTLQRHLQTHLDFRPFACNACGRTFYSQSKLKRHQVIHSEIKPYKCPVCDRRLGRTEHLKRHLLVHTDKKPYGCSSCSHTTKRLDGIRRHIKRKHGNGSAEIVSLASPMDPDSAVVLGPVLSASEPSEPKPKKSKKKKKKKPAQMPAAESVCDGDHRDAFSGNLLDVAASFGVKDLKMPGIDSKLIDDFQSKDSKPLLGHDSRSVESVSEDLKPVWDPNQMLLPSQQMQQLLYQSLVRVHPSAANPNLSDVSSRNMAPPMPVMAAARPPFQLNHGNALSHPNDAFCMNGSSVPMRYPPSVTSTGEGSSRNSNPMLLSPGSSRANIACYGQMDAGTEMMISQYFQSHQRFAPPVWGFANPNYHGY